MNIEDNRQKLRAWRRFRVALCLGIGMLAASITWVGQPPGSDWNEIWYTSRGLLRSEDPYVIGDSLHAAGWRYPLIYPGTGVVLAAPFAVLPLKVAQSTWNGLGAAGLAWVLTIQGLWGLMALGSAAFLHAFFVLQWSPLLVSGLAAPWLGFVWAAKPTIGAALFAGWPSKQALISCSLLVLVSLALIPGWPAKMWAGLGSAPHILPIVARPGGVLLLLALLRWRQPAARMLAVLALVPHTTAPYEMLPLFLIPRTPREMAVLTLLSQVAFSLAMTFRPGDLHHHLAITLARQWPFWLVLLYIPALVMVLWRPNTWQTSSHDHVHRSGDSSKMMQA